MQKEWLFGKTLSELTECVQALGMPRFSAGQIASWLYGQGVTSFDAMTNLSLRNRTLLSERYEVGVLPVADVAESTDGTKKYLFPTLQQRFIESAYIPEADRATLCVSSQSGCRMGCRFCMTARQGFVHHLTTGEILNQIRTLPESSSLTNIVYMGMGEPLDNWPEVRRSLEILTAAWGYGWSPSRITLSTIGVIPALREFLAQTKVHLAVSLHNPFADERLEMMPIQQRYPIEEVVRILRDYDFTHQRRVSFEYIVFRGLNDTPAHVAALSRLLAGLKCRINLIRFHAIPDAPMQGADEATMIRMRDALSRKGIITTIRTSRGEDIQAACGLLATTRNDKPSPQG
ncbi:MAG: 23S rRNA (adenine(2503)-C(2))-methyltransferase RlmN [Alistipes sp.]|nr:23S rRNA (adenine(2503)-C(2))-methyltransferase RlmN [Alistipes sp.]